jgi:hypothetical protein
LTAGHNTVSIMTNSGDEFLGFAVSVDQLALPYLPRVRVKNRNLLPTGMEVTPYKVTASPDPDRLGSAGAIAWSFHRYGGAGSSGKA